MQVAGNPCKKCEKPIGSTLVASWCPACVMAFHKSCLENPAECPGCNRAFEVVQREHSANEQAEAVGLVESGRRLLLTVILIYVGFRCALLALIHLGGENVVPSAVPVFLAVCLLGLVYVGYRAARLWAQVSLVIGMVFGVVLLIGVVLDGSEFGAAILLACALAVDLALFLAITASLKVRRFLEARGSGGV